MIINYQLAKEIYGLEPWFVDAKSFPVLSSILKNMRNGITLEVPEEKYNAVHFFNLKSETKIVDRPYGSYWDPGQLETDEDFEAIGIININGPITRSGGLSSYGMSYVSSVMRRMNEDSRIKGFLILADSGGGSSTAVEIMTDTINEIKQSKPVYSLIPKGGMACSAMYGIISATNKIYSEGEMDIVGSAGTMIQFEGRKANTEDADGVKYIRIYASKSTKKNIEFEEALNNNNFQLIIDDLLDPVNERFLNLIASNRPILSGTDFENGNTKFSKDAVGTFIDGIKSFNEVIPEIMADYKLNYEKSKSETNNNSNRTKSKKMTAEELKQQHPETYNSIFNAGVSSEKDRVESWMAHSETDPEMVKNGIKSGAAITGAQREELLVKLTSKTKIQNLETDSKQIPAAATAESGNEADKEVQEINNFYGDLLK